jgi:hypothetical protein
VKLISAACPRKSNHNGEPAWNQTPRWEDECANYGDQVQQANEGSGEGYPLDLLTLLASRTPVTHYKAEDRSDYAQRQQRQNEIPCGFNPGVALHPERVANVPEVLQRPGGESNEDAKQHDHSAGQPR